MKKYILIVDDDSEIRGLLSMILEHEGMRTSVAESGEVALQIIESTRPDLIILDIMMEQLNGFELLRIIRDRELTIPILLLSAKVDDVDKVHGFGLGADDYVTKPFSPVEMVARVQAHLRRMNNVGVPHTSYSLQSGIFNLDMETQILYKNGNPIHLSTTETTILRELLKSPNRVFTKSQLFRGVWHHSNYDDNTMNVYISRIRQKIEDNPKQPIYLHTVWGIGYRLITGGQANEAKS
jgi:DNA-binding response OmpR family regulator